MGLSSRKAVSSARLTAKQARKKAPTDAPHAGVILVNESKNQGTKARPKKGISCQFVGQSDWAFDLDAGLLVDALSTALLALYRQAVMEGEKPDGSGPQKELTEKVKKQTGRASQYRGYKTGYFADNIRRGKVTGSTTKAQAKILPPTNRNAFIASELKRGIQYFSTQGIAQVVIADVTSQFIEGGLENANRAADLSEASSKDKGKG